METLAIPQRYKKFLKEAKDYEERCIRGKRWGGNPILIIVDSALDSTGLSYFNVVMSKVKLFKRKFSEKKFFRDLREFSKLSPTEPKLLQVFNYPRAWYVAIEVAKAFNKMCEDKRSSVPLEVMREWAQAANYQKYLNDPIGAIKGVGLITFQYLRMQVGVDTCMPDKIIKKFSEKEFNIHYCNDFEFIKAFEKLCSNLGVSQILLSWLIWLAESDKRP